MALLDFDVASGAPVSSHHVTLASVILEFLSSLSSHPVKKKTEYLPQNYFRASVSESP